MLAILVPCNYEEPCDEKLGLFLHRERTLTEEIEQQKSVVESSKKHVRNAYIILM